MGEGFEPVCRSAACLVDLCDRSRSPTLCDSIPPSSDSNQGIRGQCPKPRRHRWSVDPALLVSDACHGAPADDMPGHRVDDERMLLSDRTKLLTVPEVADALHVSSRSVQRYIADGQLRATRIGHAVRLDPSDVASFVDAGRIVPASDGGMSPFGCRVHARTLLVSNLRTLPTSVEPARAADACGVAHHPRW